MTDPLEGVTDAHLQAALDAVRAYMLTPGDIRHHSESVTYRSYIAHARQIAANEKLAAEPAELRAKYEPEPVDPLIKAIAEAFGRATVQGDADDLRLALINHGLTITKVQPAPFTREEAERIADKIAKDALRIYMMPKIGLETATNVALFALTTPPAELRAMLGDG